MLWYGHTFGTLGGAQVSPYHLDSGAVAWLNDRMKKVVVFGKPAGGKSTFSKRLARARQLDYYPLDLIQYQADGQPISENDFLKRHGEILSRDNWVIDGLGPIPAFWSRLEAADTLVYIDLPYSLAYWWATKRWLFSLFRKPEGWPEGSSVLKGTVASWKYLRLSKRFWTPAMFSKIKSMSKNKKVIHITRPAELRSVIDSL